MIRGKIVCRHKFASNVCEKALQYATPKDRDELIRELVDVKPDGTNMCGTLLRDAYGNFPLQVCRLHFHTLKIGSPKIG